MTAADHANTVREALKWVPDGYDQVDLNHEGPLRREATQALDALQAQAEERDALRESGQRWAENVRGKEQRIVAAEAERDRLREALEEYENPGNWDTEDGPPFVWVKDSDPPRIARAALAQVNFDRAEAAEAERDKAREALDAIERDLGTLPLDHLGPATERAVSKAWAMAREKRPDPELIPSPIARAALAGEDT